MNINGFICKSLLDKLELFYSERDMADIVDEYFALEIKTILLLKDVYTILSRI